MVELIIVVGILGFILQLTEPSNPSGGGHDW